MLRLILTWLVMTVSLLIVAYLLPGIVVTGIAAALVAALIFGILNATLGLVLKILTFPLTILTLGIFWFVINAIMLGLTALLVPGFGVASFGWAFLGAILLSIINMVLRALLPEPQERM